MKPSNLVLVSSGKVKVTDFGLVRPVDPGSEPALTALGVVVGTPDYIAPEQARGEAIDERVDIYALGGTLYYLLTGSPPFRTGDPAQDKYLKVVARHLREPAPDPRGRMPDTDRELAAITRALMAKKPVDRPGYAELMEQLGAIVERLGGGAHTSPRKPTRPGSNSGGYVAKTPFVGNDAPAVRDVLASAGATPPQAHPEEDEGAKTLIRTPTLPPDDSFGLDVPVRTRGTSRVLVALTVLSALVFLTGLGLLLLGPMPERGEPTAGSSTPDANGTGATPPTTGDAGIRRVDGPAGH